MKAVTTGTVKFHGRYYPPGSELDVPPEFLVAYPNALRVVGGATAEAGGVAAQDAGATEEPEAEAPPVPAKPKPVAVKKTATPKPRTRRKK